MRQKINKKLTHEANPGKVGIRGTFELEQKKRGNSTPCCFARKTNPEKASWQDQAKALLRIKIEETFSGDPDKPVEPSLPP